MIQMNRFLLHSYSKLLSSVYINALDFLSSHCSASSFLDLTYKKTFGNF